MPSTRNAYPWSQKRCDLCRIGRVPSPEAAGRADWPRGQRQQASASSTEPRSYLEERRSRSSIRQEYVRLESLNYRLLILLSGRHIAFMMDLDKAWELPSPNDSMPADSSEQSGAKSGMAGHRLLPTHSRRPTIAAAWLKPAKIRTRKKPMAAALAASGLAWSLGSTITRNARTEQ